MKYSHASLSNQQVRDAFFVVPDLADLYLLALGADNYCNFQAARKLMRAAGGELLLIGWPDGTTVTYGLDDRTTPIDLDTLVDTYRASATLSRILDPKAWS